MSATSDCSPPVLATKLPIIVVMAAFHMSTKNEALISDDRLSKIERI